MTKAALHALTVMLALSGAAAADPVIVRGDTGQSGAGWLFGSPRDGRCWVVTAMHTVLRGDESAPFIWRTGDGQEGGAGDVWGDPALDIAFGRAEGIEPSRCLSRLGSASVEAVLRRQPQAWALAPIQTSVRPMPVQASTYGATAVRLDATRPEDVDRVQRGVSGAPVVIRDARGMETPLAMIVSAAPEAEGAVFAVRFDTIRALFAQGPPEGSAAQEDGADMTGRRYEIIHTDGVSSSPVTTASNLSADGRCWVFAPPPGQRQVSLTLRTEPGMTGVSMNFPSECGAAPDSVLLQERRGEAWRTVQTCAAEAGQARCVTAARVGAEFRLQFIIRSQAEIGVSDLRID